MVGLASHLDHVVTQSTVSLSGLDKTTSLKQTALKAAMHPRACMYVGDEAAVDVMAAQYCWLRRVGPRSPLARLRSATCKSHPQFKPDYVIRTMSE